MRASPSPRQFSHLFAVEVVEPVGEHLVHAVGVGEGDEAEPPAPLRGRVLHHHHLGDVSEFAEILLQALWSEIRTRHFVYSFQTSGVSAFSQ